MSRAGKLRRARVNRGLGFAQLALGAGALFVAGCERRSPPDPAVEAEQTASAVESGALGVGSRYQLSEATRVVPDLDTGDAAMAMAEPALLPAATVVLVEDRVEAAGTIWYQVRWGAEDSTVAWASLQALSDQQIFEVPEPAGGGP